MPSVAPIPPTLTNNLRRIGLLRLADDLNDVIARATKARWGPVALLEALVAAEIDDRARRSLERRLAHARLGRFKSLADWEWDWPKVLNRPVLERVLTLDFLAAPENVLLVGAQGLGKTMLAKNIAHQAILASLGPLHDGGRTAARSERPGNGAGVGAPLPPLSPAPITFD